MDYLTSTQAAQELGISVATVTRLVKTGQLTAHKLTPARNSPLRITRESVQKLQQQRQQ